MKIKVGVIFGGQSVEHEVSIITAVQAMGYMDRDKYDIIPIYIAKDRTWYTGQMLEEIDVFKDFESLKKYATVVTLVKTKDGFFLQNTRGIFKRNVAELDIAFPLVHGKGVEDGSLAGYLDLVGIPYVGSNIIGSALGQDKVVQKQVLEASKINIPKYTWFWDSEYYTDKDNIVKNIENLGYPVIVKPANLGSSVGITVAKNSMELDKAIMDAISFDNKILVEEVIPNLLEVNCSVLGNYESTSTSAIAEMITDNDFLTYQDKYVGGGKSKGAKSQGGKMSNSRMNIPANIDEDVEKKVRDMAVKSFNALNLSGVARVDFLINKKTNEVYVNEPNTIPGSLSFYMWTKVGKEYKTLLDDMISLAIKNYKNISKKTTSFDINILSGFSGLKGAKGLKNKIK